MILAWRAKPNGHSNQFSRKPTVKGSAKRVSRYECPLIRVACWTFFQPRVYWVLVNIWWTHAGGRRRWMRVLPLESEMLLGEFILAIVEIIWWSPIGRSPLSFRSVPTYRRDHNLSPFLTRVFLPPFVSTAVEVFHGSERTVKVFGIDLLR